MSYLTRMSDPSAAVKPTLPVRGNLFKFSDFLGSATEKKFNRLIARNYYACEFLGNVKNCAYHAYSDGPSHVNADSSVPQPVPNVAPPSGESLVGRQSRFPDKSLPKGQCFWIEADRLCTDDQGVITSHESLGAPVSQALKDRYYRQYRVTSFIFDSLNSNMIPNQLKTLVSHVDMSEIDWYAGRGLATLFVSVVLVAVYRWLDETRPHFTEKGRVFTGTQTLPVCLHCNTDLESVFVVEKHHTKFKRFYAPMACSRCSVIPSLYGSRPVALGITNDEFQVATTYSQLNSAKSRDIHTSLTNVLDSASNYSTRQAFLTTHLETLHEQESKVNWFLCIPFWDSWTRSYRQATHWMNVDKSEVEVIQNQINSYKFSRIHKLRVIWNFAANNSGRLPQMVIVKGCLERVKQLIRVPRAYYDSVFNPNASTEAVNADATPMECGVLGEISPGPEGQTAYFTENWRAFRLGPILGFFNVWDTKILRNILAIMEGRSTPKYEYVKDSDAARRFGRMYSVFKEKVLTKERVERAYREIMDSCDNNIENLLKGKFSESQIRHEISCMQVMQVEHIPKRKLNCKLETVCKPGKYPRGVVDNGLALLSINVLAGEILNHIVFAKPPDRHEMVDNHSRHDEVTRPSSGSAASSRIGTKEGGIFNRLSIKHQDRSLVLDNILKSLSKAQPGHNVMVGEVDQTAMELHERASPTGEGSLGHFMSCLQHVCRILLPKFQGHLINLHGAKLIFDLKHGMCLKIIHKNRSFTVKFKDLYLDSGWLNTALVNFLNELFATHAAHLLDPERLMTIDRKSGRFHVELGTHDFKYKSIPLHVTDSEDRPLTGELLSHVVHFKTYIEGDDGVFQLSDVFYEMQEDGTATNRLVEEQYKKLGFDTKLKYIKTGRAEFIGTHFVIENGLCNLKVPWCPALQRYMVKIGVNVSSEPTFEANIARAASLSSMFAGKVECFATIFLSLMEDMIKHNNFSDDTVIRINPYSVEERAFGKGEYTLRKLVDDTRTRVTVPYPDIAMQVRMVENSFEFTPGSFNVADLMKLSQLSEVITSDMNDEVALTYLPAILR